MKSKRILIPVVILLVVGLGVYLFRASIINAITVYEIKKAFARGQVVLPDGLHAYLIVTGSPMPDINLSGPCIAVVAGNKTFVVDAGDGSAKNIMLCGIPIGRVNALFLTHFHSDHIAGLGEIILQRWIGGSNDTPLLVIGPTGVEQVVEGFNAAYKLDDSYRIAHHDAKTAPPTGVGGKARAFALDSAFDASTVVWNDGEVKITMFKVDHYPVIPAVGYKFEYKGRTLVISGDTKYSESLAEQAVGVDLLLHEALNPKLVGMIGKYSYLAKSPATGKVMEAILTYHSSPEDVAKIAANSHVAKVVLYHIIPPIPYSLYDEVFLGDARKYYQGPITVGTDGMLISLPANSKEVEVKYLLRK